MNGRYSRFLLLVLAGLLVAAAGCTSSDVDDADSAHVVFEVQVLDSPPVEVTLDPLVGGCTYDVRDWTATANNVPKNSLAITSPFNDIELLDVTITYTCDPATVVLPGVCPPIRVIPLTATVPASGSVSFAFSPITLDDVVRVFWTGTTLFLNLRFRGATVSGDEMFLDTGNLLHINGCA